VEASCGLDGPARIAAERRITGRARGGEARGELARAALEQGEMAAITPNYWPCRSLSVSAPCMTSGTRRLATGLSGRGQQVRRACSISAAVAR